MFSFFPLIFGFELTEAVVVAGFGVLNTALLGLFAIRQDKTEKKADKAEKAVDAQRESAEENTKEFEHKLSDFGTLIDELQEQLKDERAARLAAEKEREAARRQAEQERESLRREIQSLSLHIVQLTGGIERLTTQIEAHGLEPVWRLNAGQSG